jgi:hypothetical protein
MTKSVFSKDFNEPSEDKPNMTDLNIDTILKRFNDEIKTLEKKKPISIKEYTKHVKDKKKKKEFQKISISISIKKDEGDYKNIVTKIKNIIANGGLESIYTFKYNIEKILSDINVDDTFLSELIDEGQKDMEPAKTQNSSIAQVKDFIKLLIKSFRFTYTIMKESKVNKDFETRHQIEELNNYKTAIEKFKETSKLISSVEDSPSVNRDLPHSVGREDQKNTNQSGENSSSNPLSGIGNLFSGNSGSSSSGAPPPQGPPPQNEILEGPTNSDNILTGNKSSTTDEMGEMGEMGEMTENTNSDDLDTSEGSETSKSFYDTVLSYFKGEDTKEENKENDEPKLKSASDIVKGLDLTGLFSKDKKFVPDDNDTQKIEIAESELKMLQDSEESLRQELEEQQDRITEYKKDIQNKISQQYALLEYEKTQLKNENKKLDRKQYKKYYTFVDMLKNRERFLDKREDILNNKRKKDLKELNETKKKLVSELLRQLDKEKNIVIRNKNKENSILRKQLQYYKGNNMYLQSLVDMLEDNRTKCSKIKNVKKTLKKRKKKRSKQYTHTKTFEITL